MFSDEENILHFWKETLGEYSYCVSKSFMIDPVAIKKQFILHDRVPNGLPDIMKELVKRNHLATPAQIRSGELFGKNQ